VDRKTARDLARGHVARALRTNLGEGSDAARRLVEAVKAAGGSVERMGRARLRITGPAGSVTIQEPGGESRRDLRRSSDAKLIAEQTGLELS
jgi:hypothetical protein